MDARPPPAARGPCPGTEPAGLWFITAAVVAGLIITGMSVMSQAGAAAGGAPAARPRQHPPPLAAIARGAAGQGGLRLLAQAAAACQTVPFHGVETLAWRAPAGVAPSEVEVWHTPGARPLMRVAVLGPPGWPDRSHRIVPPGGDVGIPSLDDDSMLGLSPRLVALLAANYRLAAGGSGRVAGRPAQIVTASRPGAGLAARFWLDEATHLPLRRQLFGSSGQLISDVAFARLRLGAAAVTRLPGPAATRWGDVLTAAQLSRLRGGGWPLPGPLPGHLALLGARADMTRGRLVVDLEYSDGLSVVSVFVQRGHLPPRLSGWLPGALHGQRVFTADADAGSVAWSARGYVYTVIAEAPGQALAQVVAALPHDSPPGMLGRMRDGLHRLVSWLRF